MNEKLLLFDIDNTLITSQGEKPFDEAIREVCGLAVTMGEDFSGMTDQLILAKLLRDTDQSDDFIRNAMPQLMDALEGRYIRTFNSQQIEILPGVGRMVTTLSERAHLGLVTGNLQNIAQAKLTLTGIMTYFTVGAFGDDPHTKRSDLVTLAVKRAGFEDKLDDVYVIGDTPLDIAASHEAGVTNAVGVSNGFCSVETLQAAHATIVFRNFEDTEQVLQKIGL